MIYTADITTSANTAEADAVVTTLEVSKGLVYRIEIEFPPGAAGLHYCKIMDGGFQLWPSSPGVWFHAEDTTIAFDDTYLKMSEPYQFQILTYNLDDTYDHFIQVRIGIVSKEVFMARFLPTYAYDEFKSILEAIILEQEEKRQSFLQEPFPWIGGGETE